METQRIPVVNAGEYDVVVGRGLGDELERVMPAGAKKVLLVHQPVQARRAEAIRERFAGRVEVPLGAEPHRHDGVDQLDAEEQVGGCTLHRAISIGISDK